MVVVGERHGPGAGLSGWVAELVGGAQQSGPGVIGAYFRAIDAGTESKSAYLEMDNWQFLMEFE